jgi:hypothetical protein
LKDVRWIAFPSATLNEFNAHIGLLADSMEADRNRLAGLFKIRDAVGPLMREHPTMTIREAFTALKEREDRAQSGRRRNSA